MKFFFTICLSLIVSFSCAQFAIIADKDGFCNVRTAAQKAAKVIDQLENGHLVYCFPDNTNWIDIDYSKNNKDLNGQVYKDRVIYISSFSKIPVLTKSGNSITLQKDSIKVVISEQNFDKSKHKFTFYKEEKTQIVFIDDDKYWGLDGGMPTTEYKSIEIVIGQRKINLPKNAFKNLVEPSLLSTIVNYDKASDILYVQSSNGDGAGSYEVIWKIEKGIYKERFVAYGF